MWNERLRLHRARLRPDVQGRPARRLRDEVPHFYPKNGVDESGEQLGQARDWLYTRGFGLFSIHFECDPGEVLRVMGVMNPLVPYLLCGTSKTGVNHSVVALGDEIIWDTSLVDSGIVGRADDGHTWVDLIVKLP